MTALSTDRVLLYQYYQTYGNYDYSIHNGTFDFDKTVKLIEKFRDELSFDDDNFLHHFYHWDTLGLTKSFYQWKHGANENKGTLLGLKEMFTLFMDGKKTYEDEKEVPPNGVNFRDTLASAVIGSMVIPYLFSKEFQNRHFNIYIKQGQSSPLFWLYLINPLKFLEFSVRLIEGLMQRVVQIGATTDPNDPHMIAELGWIRWMLQLNIALIFALPKFATSLIASPDSVFSAPGNLLYYLFDEPTTYTTLVHATLKKSWLEKDDKEESKPKILEQINPTLSFLSNTLYITFWATYIAHIAFILTTVIPALQVGTAIASPAMLNLLFGGTTADIIGYSAFSSLGIYLIPLVATLAGYDMYRPGDARYTYLADRKELDARAEEKANINLVDLIDPGASERRAKILESSGSEKNLAEIREESSSYADRFEDVFKAFDKDIVAAIKNRTYDDATHNKLNKAKKKILLIFHSDKVDAKEQKAAAKGCQLINEKFAFYEDEYERQQRSQNWQKNAAGFFHPSKQDNPDQEREEAKPPIF